MKRVFLCSISLIVVLLTTYSAFAATANVQNKTSVFPGAGLTVAITWTSNTTTGNLIACSVYWTSAATITIFSDSQLNTYTNADTNVNGNGRTDNFATYYAKNITGGTTPTVTVTFSGSSSAALQCHEISGADTTAPLDKHNILAQGFTAGPAAATSVTPATDGQYIFVAATDNGDGKTFTAAGGFTAAPNGTDAGAEYLIQGTAAAVTGNITLNGAAWIYTGIMTFKATGGGGTSPTFTLTLLGAGYNRQ